MWWNGGWGGWWFAMPLVMFGFWIAVIWVAVTVVRNRPGPSLTAHPAGPEEVLAQRYARGEIDDDEYRHRLDTLRGPRHPEDRP